MWKLLCCLFRSQSKKLSPAFVQGVEQFFMVKSSSGHWLQRARHSVILFQSFDLARVTPKITEGKKLLPIHMGSLSYQLP